MEPLGREVGRLEEPLGMVRLPREAWSARFGGWGRRAWYVTSLQQCSAGHRWRKQKSGLSWGFAGFPVRRTRKWNGGGDAFVVELMKFKLWTLWSASLASRPSARVTTWLLTFAIVNYFMGSGHLLSPLQLQVHHADSCDSVRSRAFLSSSSRGVS